METTAEAAAVQPTAARYEVVNDLHAEGYPALTRKDAGRYSKALIVRFGSKADASAVRTFNMKEWSGLQWIKNMKTGARICWASTKPTRGHHKGWGRMLHDLGHMIHRYRHPGQRPHGHGEHAIETELAYYVRHETDWLKPKAAPAELGPELRTAQANQKDLAALQRWQSKAKRAENAIKKLRRRIAARNRRITMMMG